MKRLVLIIPLLLAGCSPGVRVVVPPVVPPPAASVPPVPVLPEAVAVPVVETAPTSMGHTPTATAPTLDARALRLAALEGEMAALQAEKRAAEAQAAREREAAALAPVLDAATWGTWSGAVLAGVACTAAVVLLVLRVPLMPRLAVAVALGGGALVLVSRAVAELILAPWWPLVALAVVLAAAAVAALWAMARWWTSHRESWRTAQQAVAALANAHPVAAEAINRASLDRQSPGVRSFNDAVLARL